MKKILQILNRIIISLLIVTFFVFPNSVSFELIVALVLVEVIVLVILDKLRGNPLRAWSAGICFGVALFLAIMFALSHVVLFLALLEVIALIVTIVLLVRDDLIPMQNYRTKQGKVAYWISCIATESFGSLAFVTYRTGIGQMFTILFVIACIAFLFVYFLGLLLEMKRQKQAKAQAQGNAAQGSI